MAKVKARVKVPKTAEVGELVEIKTLISHPMHSGRAVDSDGKIVPRKIINSFTAKFNGNTVFEMGMRPSVSSNPFIVFPFWIQVLPSQLYTFIYPWPSSKVYGASLAPTIMEVLSLPKARDVPK